MENTIITEYGMNEGEKAAQGPPEEAVSGRQSAEKQVLLITADTPPIKGQGIFFLLSILQVEDILQKIHVRSTPFAPRFSDGVAHWRNRSLPVLSLERYLGIQTKTVAESYRHIVVRSPGIPPDENGRRMGILKILPHVEKMTLPSETRPIDISHWCHDSGRLRGAYEWGNKILIVADLRRLLSDADAQDRNGRDWPEREGNGDADRMP
ncbi:MAG: chemotaxis protein CheW [Desulfobacteraceae bacterium]|nr:chemotaxis protein CheW [Desulfobacteraceae bacterium]